MSKEIPELQMGGISYTIELAKDLRDGDMKLNAWIQHNQCRILIEESLHL